MGKAKSTPSQTFLLKFFSYDPDTGVLTRRLPISASCLAGDVVGTPNKKGYLMTQISRKGHMVHRLIWTYVYGFSPSLHIDHINRIKSDNRLSNLREVTNVQNCLNSSLSKRNKSGIKGVSFFEKNNCWIAAIGIGGKSKYLGSFKTKEEAAVARRAAMLEICGGEIAYESWVEKNAVLQSDNTKCERSDLSAQFARRFLACS